MPSEMIGGGKLANTPLSMQSEVMAIQRTLSTTSCAASGALSSQKSCFRLSGDSKRTAPLQREAMKLYVGTVCKQSVAKQDAGKSQVQEWQFEQSAPRSGYAKSCIHDEEKEDMALPAENSTKKQGIKNEKKNHHHNTGNQDSNGKHTHKRSRDAHKSRASKTIVAPHGSQTDAPDRCLELVCTASVVSCRNSSKLTRCSPQAKVTSSLSRVHTCANET
jgi:hypothetical protein